MNQTKRTNTLVLGLAFYLALPAFAGMSYSVSGSGDKKFLGFYSEVSRSGSIAVDLDLGQHLRLGLVHSQQLQMQSGHKTNHDETEFKEFSSDSQISSNSLNLTIIPMTFAVTPFIFGGLGIYRVVKKEVIDGLTSSHIAIFPGPQGGAGLGIRLNDDFSLKVTHTRSLGMRRTPANRLGQLQFNETTQIGFTYHPRT